VECPQYSIWLKAHTVTSFTFYRHLGTSLFWPYSDVIRPLPLRPSMLWHGVSCHSWTGVERYREFGGGYSYGVCRPGEWLWIDSNCNNGN